MKPFFLMLSVFITACAHLPPDIENPPRHDLSYQKALANIKNFHTAPLRWGGEVIGVENLQDSSLVQVLYYPLNGDGKPQTEKKPLGRFVIKTPEFLDPAIYTHGRLVTVAGTLSGTIERKVGEKSLSLPLVTATTLHLWPLRTRDIYSPGFGFGLHPYGFGCHPWWPHYRFHPHFFW